MHQAVTDLERNLDQAASSSRADNPESARALQEAAKQIRESKLKEKLQFSRGTIEQWDPESALTLELNIEADLQALRDQLDRAANASSQREPNPLEEALEDARNLVRSMEAMGRRLNEPAQQGQGQEGQGQEGEQGQGQGGEQGQGDASAGQDQNEGQGQGAAPSGQTGGQRPGKAG